MKFSIIEVSGIPQSGEVWVNDKTKNRYLVISANTINATNSEDGQVMVLYVRQDDNGENRTYFVREIEEFVLKFTKEKQ